MVRRFVSSCLIVGQLVSASAFAGTLKDDLYWYKSSLSFSNVTQKGVESYLNPLKGPQSYRLQEKSAPWAGNYFPMMDGGIAQRWVEGKAPEMVLNKNEYMKLSPKERQNLSPVEKYDVLLGLYDFRTTDHEMNFRGPLRQGQKIQDWEGFCNGVRCAGIMMPEPKFAVERINPRGEKVVFQPADLKALAGASYFYTEEYAQIGSPSREGRAENPPNAAVFDLVLRYGIGTANKSFIVDSHLGKQIWNESVVGYQRTLSKEMALTENEQAEYPDAVKKIKVDLILETLGEIEIKDSNTYTKDKVAAGSLLKTIDAKYTLYLDSDDRAVDGKWVKGSKVRGIDFAWFVGGKGADKDYAHQGGNPYLEFGVIKSLINESAHPKCAGLFQ
jgi:hypothetical protein